MLVYLASFEPEILSAKTFLFIPSRMNKKKERKKSLERKVYHLRKAGLVMKKLQAVLGARLHRGITATEELAH